jgi:hypothetical protein
MAESPSPTPHLKGEIIDPEIYLKVINHDLRKAVLHELFRLSVKGPIRKTEIADRLKIGYHKMLYQLMNHLDHFWIVDHEEKVRGAHEEYIIPKNVNTVYCLLGSDAAIHVLDPLADIYGKVAKVGVRCDKCDGEQIAKCMTVVKGKPCMPQTEEVIKKREIILMMNDRTMPYMPMDHFLVCTLIKSLENEPCSINLECPVYIVKALNGL